MRLSVSIERDLRISAGEADSPQEFSCIPFNSPLSSIRERVCGYNAAGVFAE